MTEETFLYYQAFDLRSPGIKKPICRRRPGERGLGDLNSISPSQISSIFPVPSNSCDKGSTNFLATLANVSVTFSCNAASPFDNLHAEAIELSFPSTAMRETLVLVPLDRGGFA